MRLCITARRVGPENPRSDLEERLRLLLGSWTCQIREAKVCLEAVEGSKGGLDARCEIEAALIASGRITVQGLGTDTESAMRAALPSRSSSLIMVTCPVPCSSRGCLNHYQDAGLDGFGEPSPSCHDTGQVRAAECLDRILGLP